MVTEWFDWYAGWESTPGLVVVDAPAMLSDVLSSHWGRRPDRIVVRPPEVPADRVELGDGEIIRVRPYRDVRLLPVDGWTVATLDDRDDFEQFLADADRAPDDLHLPPVLTDPRVQVSDLSLLGWPWPAADPSVRARIHADGTVTSGPGSRVLGRYDDPATALLRQWRWTRLADDAPQAADLRDRAEAVAARPWLPDYLCALIGIRALRTHLNLESSRETLDPVVAVHGWRGWAGSEQRRLQLQGRHWLVDLRRRRVTDALGTAAMDRRTGPPISVSLDR